jgi:hypothetical protein
MEVYPLILRRFPSILMCFHFMLRRSPLVLMWFPLILRRVPLIVRTRLTCESGRTQIISNMKVDMTAAPQTMPEGNKLHDFGCLRAKRFEKTKNTKVNQRKPNKHFGKQTNQRF